MPDGQDYTQDKSFMAASPEDQHAYLMSADSSYAKASADEQKAFRASLGLKETHTSSLPAGSYQNRPRGPILNVNETPGATAGKRFLGAIGGLGEHGEIAPTTGETFLNIPKSAYRVIKNEWTQPTEGGPKGISTPLSEGDAELARVLFPAHLAARGIEGIAGSAENAGADIWQGIRRGDPRAVAAGTGEAAGTIGQLEGSEAVGEAAGRILPSRARLGLALRNEKGTLKPSVSTIGRAGGTALGGYVGSHFGYPEGGAIAGALGGRALMDALVPERPTDIPTKQGIGAPLPSSEEFYQHRAEDLTRRGKEQAAIDKTAQRETARTAKEEAKAREAVPISEGPTALQHEATRAAQSAVARRNARQFVPVSESPNRPAENASINGGIIEPTGRVDVGPEIESEGSPARWTNEKVMELAAKGNRAAISQVGARQLPMPPNARYVMGDIDYRNLITSPREVTKFSPIGEPIRQAVARPLGESAPYYDPFSIEGPFPEEGKPTEAIGGPIGRPEATNEPLATQGIGSPIGESDVEMAIRRGASGPAKSMAEEIQAAEQRTAENKEAKRQAWEKEQAAKRKKSSGR